MKFRRVNSLISPGMKGRIKSSMARIPFIRRHFESLAKYYSYNGILSLMQNYIYLEDIEKDFADFCLQNYELSYSQISQDLFVLWVLGRKSGGKFVEFGAADGVTHSNTLCLEKHFAWEGLLIEPLPWHFVELKRNRPGSHIMSGAVDPSFAAVPGQIQLTVDGQLSAITGLEGSDQHLERRLSSNSRVHVPGININTAILNAFPDGRLDFMSIDVEGPERQILAGVDFTCISIDIICCEVNNREADRRSISELMANRGYKSIFGEAVTRSDIWFIKQEMTLPSKSVTFQ